MKKKIIKYLQNYSGKPLRRRQLARFMGIKEKDYRKFRDVIKGLIKTNQLLKKSGGFLMLTSSAKKLKGTIALTSHGYGFVTTKEMSSDIFIRRESLNGALNGDSVEVAILQSNKHHKSEGIVQRIISRATDIFIGTVTVNKGKFNLQIEPVSPKRGIILEKKQSNEVIEGDIVSVKVIDWGSSDSPVITSFVERIGSIKCPEDDMAVVCYKYDLEPDFPDIVEKESNRFSITDINNEIPNRIDLRNLLIFTIDPWDARDVDDGISLEELENENYLIGVHIADVSFFVKEGSELDREAQKRSNSVYFSEGTVRMLPDNLSAELCSLLPNVERLAMSVFIELDSNFNVISSRLENSIIKSAKAFTYGEVQEIFDGKNRSHSKILRKMNRISKGLMANRHKVGSLDFDIPEPIFKFGNGGVPYEILSSERLESHRLVEEFMLLANREVSKKVVLKRKKKDEFIFRIHDEPSADDMNRFVSIIRRFKLFKNIPLKIKPKDFQYILEKVESSPYHDLIEKLALRTMSKAIYSIHNRGHFGLAFKTYTHFTSPIRRYSDILVHRYLKKHLLRDKFLKGISREKASSVAKYITDSEIKSIDAEREYIKLKQIRWLSQHIGEKFNAIISGVITSGLFAELMDNMVEGYVSIESLRNDSYYFDDHEMAIVGRKYKEIYRLGSKIEIQVRSVNIEKRRADFNLVES